MNQLIIGSFYQWSTINIYISSYFKIRDETVTVESNAVAFPLTMFCVGLTMRLGLYLADKSHPILVLSISQFISALLVFIASYMDHIWTFTLFFGILFGLNSGLAFMIPIV